MDILLPNPQKIKNLSNLSIEGGSWLLEEVNEAPLSLKYRSEIELIQSEKDSTAAEILHPPSLLSESLVMFQSPPKHHGPDHQERTTTTLDPPNHPHEEPDASKAANSTN